MKAKKHLLKRLLFSLVATVVLHSRGSAAEPIDDGLEILPVRPKGTPPPMPGLRVISIPGRSDGKGGYILDRVPDVVDGFIVVATNNNSSSNPKVSPFETQPNEQELLKDFLEKRREL